MLNLVYYGDEHLSQVSEDVRVFDDNLAKVAEDMLSSLSKFGGVGLAGVQVGYNYKIFVTDTRTPGERLVFVNPVIIETSEDRVPYNEGCLSFPGVYRDVVRPSSVKVQAQDVNGKKFIKEATGLLARVIQHEYDHLYGKVFLDHLDDKHRQSAFKQASKNIDKISKKGK